MTAKDENRPALPKLSVGDEVIVRLALNETRRRNPEDRYIPAKIAKAGRVWVEMTAGRRAWRMRMDTQDEGTQYSGSNASFVTPEQHAWDERLRKADKFLREQGIRIGDGGGWTMPARRVFLADVIRQVVDGEWVGL